MQRQGDHRIEDRRLRDHLAVELVTAADEIRAHRAAVTPEMPIEPLWNDFLTQDAFAMIVLVDCAKHVLCVESLRATSDEFKESLRTEFGMDISTPCWTHHELNNARLVRHALSHAAGRETPDLKKQKHGIRLKDGVLQIVPNDNLTCFGDSGRGSMRWSPPRPAIRSSLHRWSSRRGYTGVSRGPSAAAAFLRL